MEPGADLPDDLEQVPPSEKGIARKNQILEATLRIVGTAGITGLSMRAVAAEANLPLGAVGYYFQGKDDLISAAFRRHTRRETKRVVHTISQMGVEKSPQEFAEKLADFIISGLSDSKDQLFAEYQFLLESTRRADLERASSAWLESLTAHVQEVVTALGSSSPKLDSRLILTVLAGLEIDHLAAPLRPSDERAIRAVLARLLDVFVERWKVPPGETDMKNRSHLTGNEASEGPEK